MIVRVTSGVKNVRTILPLVKVIAVFWMFRGIVSMTAVDEFTDASKLLASTADAGSLDSLSVPDVIWAADNNTASVPFAACEPPWPIMLFTKFHAVPLQTKVRPFCTDVWLSVGVIGKLIGIVDHAEISGNHEILP